MTDFMLFDIQKDWKEENDLADAMPEKLYEMNIGYFSFLLGNSCLLSKIS